MNAVELLERMRDDRHEARRENREPLGMYVTLSEKQALQEHLFNDDDPVDARPFKLYGVPMRVIPG